VTCTASYVISNGVKSLFIPCYWVTSNSTSFSIQGANNMYPTNHRIILSYFPIMGHPQTTKTFCNYDIRLRYLQKKYCHQQVGSSGSKGFNNLYSELSTSYLKLGTIPSENYEPHYPASCPIEIIAKHFDIRQEVYRATANCSIAVATKYLSTWLTVGWEPRNEVCS